MEYVFIYTGILNQTHKQETLAGLLHLIMGLDFYTGLMNSNLGQDIDSNVCKHRIWQYVRSPKSCKFTQFYILKDKFLIDIYTSQLLQVFDMYLFLVILEAALNLSHITNDLY